MVREHGDDADILILAGDEHTLFEPYAIEFAAGLHATPLLLATYFAAGLIYGQTTGQSAECPPYHAGHVVSCLHNRRQPRYAIAVMPNSRRCQVTSRRVSTANIRSLVTSRFVATAGCRHWLFVRPVDAVVTDAATAGNADKRYHDRLGIGCRHVDAGSANSRR